MSETESGPVVSRANGPTAVITGINLLAFASMVLVGGRQELKSVSTHTLMRFGADYGPLVLEGQAFRLVTNLFLHLNALHLLMNSIALVAIGPLVERDYGRARFVAIYLVSGIAGSLLSVAINHADPVVSAGASGAICGVIAAGAVRAFRERRLVESRALFLWGGATLIFGVLIRADNAAHLGGLVAGAISGAALARSIPTGQNSMLPSVALIVIAMSAFGFAIRYRTRAESASELVNRGVDLARADDDAGAIAAYQRALELEPNDSTAHYDLGLALERLERYDEAIRHLERSLELRPSDTCRHALAGAEVNHGVKLARDGKYVEAIVAYQSALEIEAGNANTHRNLGLALAKAGDRVAGIRELRRAVELSGTQEMKAVLVDALLDDGRALLSDGKKSSAIARFREAKGLYPDDWHTRYALGSALISSDPDEAVKELTKAWESEHSELTQSALREAIEARRDARADGGKLGEALDDLQAATLLGLEKPNRSGDAARPSHAPNGQAGPDASIRE